ncbi:MAG TPA: ATP-binding protein [Acidimicrobiales bacterium]|nr:ATP-binding protein [Acidimicrobiales bacterium]
METEEAVRVGSSRRYDGVGVERRAPGPPRPAARTVTRITPVGFLHTAVLHRTTEELVDQLAPLVGGWLSMRDRVFVNLSSPRADALRVALGADADRVRWSDASRWLPHPARRLRALQELVAGEERRGSGQLRFVTERAFPTGPPELVNEWERFDAVLNDAFESAALTIVCVFDLAVLPGAAERAGCTHPVLGVDPALPSDRYLGARDFLARPRTVSELPESAVRAGGCVTPTRARELVRTGLAGSLEDGAKFPAHAVDHLAVVTTELVTNAWQAGARWIQASCWRDAGEMGVQVDDDGPGLTDPFAGYRRPSSSVVGGRGLWIVRQLADLVEIVPSGQGTTARARTFATSRAVGHRGTVRGS